MKKLKRSKLGRIYTVLKRGASVDDSTLQSDKCSEHDKEKYSPWVLLHPIQ